MRLTNSMSQVDQSGTMTLIHYSDAKVIDIPLTLFTIISITNRYLKDPFLLSQVLWRSK